MRSFIVFGFMIVGDCILRSVGNSLDKAFTKGEISIFILGVMLGFSVDLFEFLKKHFK